MSLIANLDALRAGNLSAWCFAVGVLLFPTVVIGTAAPVAAQVNIEALRPDELQPGVSGTLGGDLAIQTGNTDLIQVGIQAKRYDVDASGTTTLMIADGGLGFLSRHRFASSGLFHYRRTYAGYTAVAPEWYGQANYDRARSLTFRVVAGAGARTSGFQGAWGHVGGGTGLMLEHERLSLPDSAAHPARTTVLRSNNFATLRLVNARELVLTSTTYMQPQLGSVRDVRILEDLALASPVTERLALTIRFNLRYDSRPPDGISSLDTRLRTGLTLSY